MAVLKITRTAAYYEILHSSLVEVMDSVYVIVSTMSSLDLNDNDDITTFIELKDSLKDKILDILAILKGEKRRVPGVGSIWSYLSGIYNGTKNDSLIRTQIRRISDSIPKLKGISPDSLSSIKELNYIDIANINNLTNLFIRNSDTNKTNAEIVIENLRTLATTFGVGMDSLKSILRNIGGIGLLYDGLRWVEHGSCTTINTEIEIIEECISSENYGLIDLTKLENEINVIQDILENNPTSKFENAAGKLSSDVIPIVVNISSIFVGKVYDSTNIS
jgi:hypothetical protein